MVFISHDMRTIQTWSGAELTLGDDITVLNAAAILRI